MAKKNTFTFYGKIRKLKENGYTEYTGDGWTIKQLQFQMICGNNVHYAKVKSFVWDDTSKRVAQVFGKNKGADGKSEKLNIKWEDRFDQSKIDQVAAFSLFEVDTDTSEHRASLEQLEDKTDYTKSVAKQKKFVFDSDFLDYVNKVLNNDKSQDMIFKINGDISYSYSSEKGQYYREFHPQKITRVPSDTQQSSNANVHIFFSPSDVDRSFVEDTGDIIINTHSQYYDSSVKNDAFVPLQFRIAADSKLAGGLLRKLESEAKEGIEIREYGIVFECVNGAPQIEFTEDMLTDEQRDDIECGLTTFEDISKAMGYVQGDRVTENRIVGIMRNYALGPVDTGYTIEDVNSIPHSKDSEVETASTNTTSTNDTVKQEKTKSSASEIANVFDDDDDEI